MRATFVTGLTLVALGFGGLTIAGCEQDTADNMENAADNAQEQSEESAEQAGDEMEDSMDQNQ